MKTKSKEQLRLVETVDVPQEWRETKRGKPIASFHNAKAGLINMGITTKHDLFHDVTIIGHRDSKLQADGRLLYGELSDPTLIRLRTMFSEAYGFDAGANNIYDAVRALAFENCFDPILDLCDEAQRQWEREGVERLDAFAVEYLKAEDTELNRAIIRKHLIASVRRARRPGCQYQLMPILESPEGWNKSSAIKIIAGAENFSDENILATRGKEAMELLRTIWHHENAELAGIRKSEVEHVKSYISRDYDMHRPAYGRVLVKQPRRSVEWGTTNDAEYLPSQTGNRRFASMFITGRIDLEKLLRDRLLIIGEAAHYEAQGESLVIDEALWPKAHAEQEKRRARDPWEDVLVNIPKFVIDDKGKQITIIHARKDGREMIASADVLTYVLCVLPAQQTSAHGMRLSNSLKHLGWQRNEGGRVHFGDQPVRGYWRFSDGSREATEEIA